MPSKPWLQDSEKFTEANDRGHSRQAPVRDFLLAQGFDVYMPPKRTRESYAEAEAGSFWDQTDLWVNGYAVEVKTITDRINPRILTDFKRDNIIVDSLRSFNHKSKPPLAYVLRNADGPCGIVITKDGRQPDWPIIQKHDPRRDFTDQFLAVPLTKFRPMQELLDLLRSLPPLTNPVECATLEQ